MHWFKLASLVKNLHFQHFLFLLGEVLASVQGNNEVGLWNMESQFRQLVLWASSSPLLSTNQSNSQSVTAMQSIQNHEMNVLITGSYLIYKGSQPFLPYFWCTDLHVWELSYLTHQLVAQKIKDNIHGDWSQSFPPRIKGFNSGKNRNCGSHLHNCVPNIPCPHTNSSNNFDCFDFLG